MKSHLTHRRFLELEPGFFWRVLWLDRFALPVALLLLACWTVALFALTLGYIPVYVGRIVFSAQDVRNILLTTLVVTLLGGGYLVRRALAVRALLQHAIPVQGRVSRIARKPLTFQVEYFFTYQHQPHTAIATIRRHRVHERHPALQPGRTITVLVHQFDPTRSFPRELYEPYTD